VWQAILVCNDANLIAAKILGERGSPPQFSRVIPIKQREKAAARNFVWPATRIFPARRRGESRDDFSIRQSAGCKRCSDRT
jgi:hypothetical protein